MKHIGIVFSILILIGCESQKDEVPLTNDKPNSDSVRITSALPETGISLKQGSVVNLKYEVEYNLASSEGGSITLVVQDASMGTLANELYVVHKGKGTETLEAEITVPDTRAIEVYTPLSPQGGGSSTSIVDNRYYKVEP